ncbi:ABC transporter [Betaproteobacteria bacterium]|nr:ABC transporter [Betaproteobacteria bacterium]
MTFTAADPSPIVRVEHLTFDYPGRRALDDVSFALMPASITALVGPNGAGKTTLLRSVAALEEPRCGRIFIHGIDAGENPREAHRLMGYLPDHFGLYQDLSAQECVRHAALSRGLTEAEADAAVRRTLEQVQLTDKLDEQAGLLSRGQRQRLALAQAIVHRPRLLLADEPASGLDPEARAELAGLMKALAAEGMTILVSSHILAELEHYCTAMLVLDDGHLRAHQSLASSPTQSSRPKRLLRIRLADAHDTGAAFDLTALHRWAQDQGLESRLQASALLIEGDLDDRAQSRLLHELVQAGWPVLEFSPHTRALQDVYLDAVGRQEQPA